MRYLTKKDLVYPSRGKNSHKGKNGTLLIIGGSENYAGAVALAGLAALRAGCDMVTIAAPEKVAWSINSLTPDLITIKLKGENLKKAHISKIKNQIKKSDVVLIGNGIGEEKMTQQFLKNLIKLRSNKLVIDADALKFINVKDVENSILTPHKKEYGHLKTNSKVNSKSDLKKNLDSNILVLKGRIDQIILKNKIFYNKTGNEGMTKGGTGDILAGLIAGFYAQNCSKLQSSINGTYITGMVGDKLKKKKGYSYIASDLIKDMETL